MKTLIALTMLLGAQTQAARILEGTHDKANGVLHFVIDTKQKCTRPMYELVESNPCGKRACFYILKETSRLRVYCGEERETTIVTVPAPAENFDYTFMGDEGGIAVLEP